VTQQITGDQDIDTAIGQGQGSRVGHQVGYGSHVRRTTVDTQRPDAGACQQGSKPPVTTSQLDYPATAVTV
jgi:hypothetical protein